MSDSELIYLARQGCNYAYDNMYKTYLTYVEKVCKGYYFNYDYIFDSSAEVFDLCRWVLDDAIKTYFDNKNASFKTYLTNRIRYVVLGHVRNEYKERNLANSGNVNLSALEDTMPLDRLNIVQESSLTNTEKVMCNAMMEDIKNSFNSQDNKLFKLYLAGHTYPEIEKITKVSKRTIKYRIDLIIAKLKADYGLTK